MSFNENLLEILLRIAERVEAIARITEETKTRKKERRTSL
jgi:hypothetical protein